MSVQMGFLGGFILGAITAFVVLAVPMRQRYWELTLRWQKERARRIEAEGHGQHTNDALRVVSRHEWGGPLSDLGISGNEPIRPQSEAESTPIFVIDEDDWQEATDE